MLDLDSKSQRGLFTMSRNKFKRLLGFYDRDRVTTYNLVWVLVRPRDNEGANITQAVLFFLLF
jgi:hypothetical protein